jgi:hypothetical protein
MSSAEAELREWAPHTEQGDDVITGEIVDPERGDLQLVRTRQKATGDHRGRIPLTDEDLMNANPYRLDPDEDKGRDNDH